MSKTQVKGWTRKHAASKAREISTNPVLCRLDDGSYIALGDYCPGRGSFVEWRGGHGYTGDFEWNDQIDLFACAERL